MHLGQMATSSEFVDGLNVVVAHLSKCLEKARVLVWGEVLVVIHISYSALATYLMTVIASFLRIILPVARLEIYEGWLMLGTSGLRQLLGSCPQQQLFHRGSIR